jgi:hypothetical protein
MSEGKSNWRKASRRATQLAVMDERAGREDAHFLAERAKALGRGAERVPSAAEQVAEERRLFGSHSGAAGINFSEYTQISVTRSGVDAEQVPRTRCPRCNLYSVHALITLYFCNTLSRFRSCLHSTP